MLVVVKCSLDILLKHFPVLQKDFFTIDFLILLTNDRKYFTINN